MYYLKRLVWNDLSEKQRSLFICIWLPLMFHCPPTFPILGQAAFRVFQAGGLRKDSLLGRRGRQEGFADVFASVKKILVKKWDLAFCIGRKQSISVLALSTASHKVTAFRLDYPTKQKTKVTMSLHMRFRAGFQQKEKKNRKEVIRSSRRNWHSSRKPVQ